MGIKSGIKKMLNNINLSLTDVLYKRPYSDPEDRLRQKAENELLHLDLVITECCSLKCRDCSNLMQYYQKPENLSSDGVISDLARILECFRVKELKILGGEPFVNQKVLSDVLRYLTDEMNDRVDTISIITNGTIIPSRDCINAIKDNPKTIITFSNYGNLSAKQDELIGLCKENGIKYYVTDDSFYWHDFGRPIEYNETEEFVKRQYKNCYNRKNCNTLYRGALYACPRQAHGIRLGLLPDNKDEYVDLTSPEYPDNNALKSAVLGLVRRKEPISTCRCCITGKYIRIRRGVQNF